MRHEDFAYSMFVSYAPLSEEVLSRILGAFRFRDSTIVDSPIYTACQLDSLYKRVRTLSDL